MSSNNQTTICDLLSPYDRFEPSPVKLAHLFKEDAYVSQSANKLKEIDDDLEQALELRKVNSPFTADKLGESHISFKRLVKRNAYSQNLPDTDIFIHTPKPAFFTLNANLVDS